MFLHLLLLYILLLTTLLMHYIMHVVAEEMLPMEWRFDEHRSK